MNAPKAPAPRAPLYALVLAAGSGRRFGGDKLLAPLAGRPLIDGAVRAALASPAARVFVVTGHDAERVGAAAVAAAARAGDEARLALVHAQDHAEGMGASLRSGIAALPDAAGGVFIFLGDMPYIPDGLAARLAAAIGEAPAAFPVHKGRRGHPALFAAPLIPALRLSSGDQGAKTLLDGLGAEAVAVEIEDPGVVMDVDRPQDLRTLGG